MPFEASISGVTMFDSLMRTTVQGQNLVVDAADVRITNDLGEVVRHFLRAIVYQLSSIICG